MKIFIRQSENEKSKSMSDIIVRVMNQQLFYAIINDQEHRYKNYLQRKKPKKNCLNNSFILK